MNRKQKTALVSSEKSMSFLSRGQFSRDKEREWVMHGKWSSHSSFEKLGVIKQETVILGGKQC